jgi:hypothetical protein
VFLAVFYSLVLAKKHSVVIMSGENLGFKRLGLHYNAFSIRT